MLNILWYDSQKPVWLIIVTYNVQNDCFKIMTTIQKDVEAHGEEVSWC